MEEYTVRKIRIGFVGAGFMGQLAHLTNYANLDECEVVAIAEPRRELAEKVAQRYGIKEVFKDHLELLNKCEVDAIVAAQPYTHHIKLIPDILKAKKPLLTEKPLALSPEAGEELVRLAQENNVLYMIGNHKRSDPAMEYAKKLVDEWKATGLYGKMKLIRITMPPGDWVGGANKPLTSNEPYPEIEHEAMPQYFDEATGKLYNSFVNYYIHQVNAMHFFYGEPYDVTFADKSGVLLVTESKSGVCGTIEMAPFNTSIDWQESVLIAFEKGYIKVELPPPLASQLPGRVTVMKDNGNGIPTIEQPILPRISAMAQQARNFLAAVRGERPAPCEAKDAVEDLKIALKYVEMFSEMQ
jgi:predicted dehydrogenase